MSLNHCSMAPTFRATCCTISQPLRQLSIARFQKSSLDDLVVEQAVPIDERPASLGRIVTRPSGGSRMASVNPLLEPLAPHTSHDDDETGELHAYVYSPAMCPWELANSHGHIAGEYT